MLSPTDNRRIQSAVATRGINICVGIPALLLLSAIFARNYFPFLANPAFASEELQIVGYAFIGVAAVDVLAAFILKRRRLSPEVLKLRIAPDPAVLADRLAEAFVPVFFVATAPALYGLIFYFLGGDLDTYVLISVFCPAGLLLLKPKEEEVERLAAAILGLPVRNDDDE